MRSRRNLAVLVVLLALFVAIAALSFGGGVGQVARESVTSDTPARVSVERDRSGPASDDARIEPARRTQARAEDRRAREALRADIVRALERRGVPAAADPARARAPDAVEPAPTTAGMVDRIGDRPALLERFNADFMPLADECIADARERVPDLQGMVAIDATLLAERDVGAIVESATPSAINEVTDPQLLECLQETLLSMALPGEAVDGLDGVMISLRTEPDADAR